MTEHEHTEPAATESAPRRRGTFQPAAEPIAPKSIDEAEGLIMPVYAEPVVRGGDASAAPAATEPSGEHDEKRAVGSRLRRAANIATVGMVVALIAVVVAAFLPTPDRGSTTAYDAPALADTRTSPSQDAPMAAEGGRVRVDLHKAARDGALPDEGAAGGSADAQASAPVSPPPTTADAPPPAGGSTPGTDAGTNAPSPSGSATAPSTAPSPTGTIPATAPTSPPPTASSPPPSSTPPPSEPPARQVPAEITSVDRSTGLLTVTFTVGVSGESGRTVAVSGGGTHFGTVEIGPDGSATLERRFADVAGVINALRELAFGDFTAAYV